MSVLTPQPYTHIRQLNCVDYKLYLIVFRLHWNSIWGYKSYLTLVKNPYHRKSLTRLRISALNKPNERGRYKNIPKEHYVCTICHTFLKEAYALVPQLNKLSQTDQLLFLMKAHNSNLNNIFAAYVHYVLPHLTDNGYFNWPLWNKYFSCSIILLRTHFIVHWIIQEGYMYNFWICIICTGVWVYYRLCFVYVTCLNSHVCTIRGKQSDSIYA